MTRYFTALDVHCAFSEMAVVTGTGKLVRRDRLPTTIPAIREALAAGRSPRRVTFEEGPLADWLSRERRDHVDERVVCEPRRNHWIARDGDKDDAIDALKLAELYRGVTFYACLDTPWRFKSKAALWKYCGIGLERRHSGNGPVKTRLSRRGNRRLKNVLHGAARSAIAQSDNPFADKFQSWIEEEGLPVPHARRNVARCLAATMWSLWKTGQRYDSSRVAVPAKAK